MEYNTGLSALLTPLLLMSGRQETGKGGLYHMLLVCMMYMLSMLLECFMKRIRDVSLHDIPNKIFGSRHTKYKIRCNIVYKHNTYYDANVPLPFKAVMNNVYEKILKDQKTTLKYHIVEEMISFNKNMKIVMFDNPWVRFPLSDNLKVSISYSEDKSEKNDFTYKTYTIELSSNDNMIKSVMDFVYTAIAEYDVNQIYAMSNDTKVFILNEFDENNMNPTYEEMAFDTTKTFENMFFDKKDCVIEKLQDFAENHGRYKKLGIPYTLGFMFHGEPGTGKTSAIKAIAAHTKRHIVIIPVKKIVTADTLKRIFMNERINDIKVPMDKRLYVFEEIDCSQWKDIVTSRDIKKSMGSGDMIQQVPSIDKNTVILEEVASTLKSIVTLDTSAAVDIHPKEKNKTFDLTLGDVLDILDGMIEMPGRMIIMTSNHPEIIDPALLRPGRIDMIIEFTKLSKKNIADMYKLWFDEELDKDTNNLLQDGVFTQAEIGNIFSNHKNKSDIIQVLRNGENGL
jgi:AAA+ superfamily predicted ATPase